MPASFSFSHCACRPRCVPIPGAGCACCSAPQLPRVVHWCVLKMNNEFYTFGGGGGKGAWRASPPPAHPAARLLAPVPLSLPCNGQGTRGLAVIRWCCSAARSLTSPTLPRAPYCPQWTRRTRAGSFPLASSTRIWSETASSQVGAAVAAAGADAMCRLCSASRACVAKKRAHLTRRRLPCPPLPPQPAPTPSAACAVRPR